MDVVLLSRLQFAFTIMFHYIFPPLTIGLGIILAYLQTRHYFTKKPIFAVACQFWTKIFVLNFAIGVSTGIVMEFQFGTNWATYSRFVGDVFGSALAAEGIFAFFLESGFLAVVAFGRERVSAGLYLFSVYMVAIGSVFSSVWIVVANSWQQTPAGHHIVDILRSGTLADGTTGMVPWVVDGVVQRRAEIVNFLDLVFNPSTVQRLSHVLLGCCAVGAFFVLSISAYYLLTNTHKEFARHSFNGALLFGLAASLGLGINGHTQAQNVYKYQPAKLAAFEGHFETGRGDLNLIGWPNAKEERIDFGLYIPGGLSFMVFDDLTFSKQVVGLDRFKDEDQPPLVIPYLSWRSMVGLGGLMIAICGLGLYFRVRNQLDEKRWLLWTFVFAIGFVMIANQSGWIAAEVGRQPWTVHPPIVWNEDGSDLKTAEDGLYQYDEKEGLRTSDSISVAVSVSEAKTSLILFMLLYLSLAAVWILVLDRKIRQGPKPLSESGKEEHGFRQSTIDRQHAKLSEEHNSRGGAI
ncbi:cytochrome ubiquinol oxidase subunit I [Desulfosediminicola flagellatus]|uniref:cytochrome ubiquinol oxidase subunit I n=1 Tax=Desulfosediminicola flagellatus TaxID=2569541 RepID=UPI0010ACAD36|nr:cytochrome ubiquinol oxidase subunit I [Desulfosediminicola flagellatus]